MELNEYQRKAMVTCMPSSENFSYMLLNLVGEVGELAGRVAKAIRHDVATVSNDAILTNSDVLRDLEKEAGDVLWQLSGLCTVMGWDLEDIAQQNLDKLADRKKRNVIDGNGDYR